MKQMKKLSAALVLLTGAALSSLSLAADQYIPILSYRVGAYAAGGSGFYGGAIDYLSLVNANGGVNGVKFAWEECETEYNAARGVECYERLKDKKGAPIEPLSTGIAYGILDRLPADKTPMTTLGYGRADATNGKVFPWVFPLITHYWDQAAGMVQYLGGKSGGVDKLKGKKIAFIYHDSAYGKEPHQVLDALAAKHGFELMKIPVTPPGSEQQSQWLQIRQASPDYVILWGWGVMNAVAIQTAKRTGYPVEKMLGVWWAGSEEDVIPAGDAAKGYAAMTITVPGDYPVVDEIRKKVYAAGKGNLANQTRIGSIYHLRGITAATLWVEAIRNAQNKFGKGKVMSPEQIRWGLENLNVDDKRQKELGVAGLFPTVKTSCDDHEGSGMVKVQEWDGSKWKVLTPNWIEGDRKLVRDIVDSKSEAYAKEKGITPACL